MRVRAASMTQVALTQAARFSPDEYATLLELPDTYRELAKKGDSHAINKPNQHTPINKPYQHTPINKLYQHALSTTLYQPILSSQHSENWQ